MKRIYVFASLLVASITSYAQFDLNKVLNDAKTDVKKEEDKLGGGTTTSGKTLGANLSNDDIIKGLKEALSVGTNNSSSAASKLDGFYKNPKITIPFPHEAIEMKNTLDELGLKSQTDKFVETLNRGAEEASKQAAPIFLNAITNMTITDGLTILRGKDTAATSYLKGKTNAQLAAAFLPTVKAALQKVQVTKYWNPLVTKYNKIPLVQKQNPDLDKYVTAKAIDGLFTLIAEEEAKIRKDPAAQVTDILKKVFGGK